MLDYRYMAIRRFDEGDLSSVERTPQGGLRVDAALTRTGVFTYINADGSVRREFRPATEVFRADGLASLEGAPVTNLHPQGLVNTETFREVAVGHVHSAPRQEGNKIVAQLIIQDQSTIGQIEKGDLRQISCGYTCDLDHTPGQTDMGERYDAVQTNIVYNHVAIVPRGRAGREVALRLDSDDNQIPTGEETTMENTNEETQEVTEEVVEEVAEETAVEETEAVESARLDAITAERDALQARVAELQARCDSFDTELCKAVEERLALLHRAEKVGVEVRADMAGDEISKAILGKLMPGVELEGKSEAYVAAALDILETGAAGNAAEVRADAVAPREDSESTPEAPDVLARRRMIQGGN